MCWQLLFGPTVYHYIDQDITIRKKLLIGKCNNHINYLYMVHLIIAKSPRL